MSRRTSDLLMSQSRNLGLIGATLLLSLYVATQRPSFATFENWRAILLNASFVAIPAVSTAILVIAGKVDLSIGSIYGFGAILASWLAANAGLPWALAVAAGIVAGGLIGLINGLLVRRIPVSPIIVTLGTLTLLYGVNLVFTAGQGIRGIPDDFTWLGRLRVLEIPSPVWVWAIVALLAALVLHVTRVGRHIFAIGGSEEAAATAGIGVRGILLWVFAVNGAMAALAGILSASRLQSADANLGRGSELTILTAVILGGVAFTGGEGTIVGVVIASIFLAVIQNGLIALSVDPAWSYIVTGAVLIIAVGSNQLALEARNRRQKSLMMRTEGHSDIAGGAAPSESSRDSVENE